MKSSSSPDSSRTSSSTAEPEFKVKTRHVEPRVFYTDYDISTQKTLISRAQSAVKLVAERGVESEKAFFNEVSTIVKEASSSEGGKKCHVIAGNNFHASAKAVKGSISFFAIGDVKFLVYST